MADIGDPVDLGSRLEDVGFAEFSANLVLKIFNGLVAANLNQTEAYLQLVQAVSKDLTTYINDTKDDINGAEILQFLTPFLTTPTGSGSQPQQLTSDGEVTSALVTKLNSDLKISETDLNQATENDLSSVLTAVARRIAANKYDLLKEMVKQGLLRLVVTRGVIETKLTFSASVNKYFASNATSYNRTEFDVHAKAETGKAISKWIKASASANYTNLTIRTTNQQQVDTSGSRVDIFGSVLIEFKTDFLPLA